MIKMAFLLDWTQLYSLHCVCISTLQHINLKYNQSQIEQMFREESRCLHLDCPADKMQRFKATEQLCMIQCSVSCFLILRGENGCTYLLYRVCKRVKVQGRRAERRIQRLTGNNATEGGRPGGEKCTLIIHQSSTTVQFLGD